MIDFFKDKKRQNNFCLLIVTQPPGGGGGGGGFGLPPVSPAVSSSSAVDMLPMCSLLQLPWSSAVWNGLGHSISPNHMISCIMFYDLKNEGNICLNQQALLCKKRFLRWEERASIAVRSATSLAD